MCKNKLLNLVKNELKDRKGHGLYCTTASPSKKMKKDKKFFKKSIYKEVNM